MYSYVCVWLGGGGSVISSVTPAQRPEIAENLRKTNQNISRFALATALHKISLDSGQEREKKMNMESFSLLFEAIDICQAGDAIRCVFLLHRNSIGWLDGVFI